MEYVLFFLLGISIGSFLNVLIDRLPRNESVMKGRSYCERCKTVLRWYDLIPLLSFVQIGGRCRYCHARLSFYYPIVEFITGVIFAFIVFLTLSTSEESSASLRFALPPSEVFITFFQLVYILYIASSLIVIFFADLKYGIIPNRVLYPMIIISFLTLSTSEESSASLRFTLPPSEVLQPIFNFQFSIFNQISIYNYLMSAVGSFLFFLSIFLITRGKGMGFGDVKLAFFMGLFLGFPKIISAFYIAFLTGAIVSIILVLVGRKKFKGGTVPFGPFLVIGTLISFFVGDKLVHIFLNGIF